MSPYPAGVGMEPDPFWTLFLFSLLGAVLGGLFLVLALWVGERVTRRAVTRRFDRFEREEAALDAKHRAEMEQALADLERLSRSMEDDNDRL